MNPLEDNLETLRRLDTSKAARELNKLGLNWAKLAIVELDQLKIRAKMPDYGKPHCSQIRLDLDSGLNKAVGGILSI